jgi:alpha-glucosidase
VTVPAYGRVLLTSGEVTVTDEGEAKVPGDTTVWWTTG